MHFDDRFFWGGVLLILSSAGLQAAQAARSGLQLTFGARHGRGITVLTEVTSTKHGRGITVLTTLLPQNLASGISVLMVVRGGL